MCVNPQFHLRFCSPVRNEFNPYDLYSKGSAKPNLKEFKPHYNDSFAEFLPEKLHW